MSNQGSDVTRSVSEIQCNTDVQHSLPDVMHVTLSPINVPRPSPSAFAYCKPSKTGGGNGLGMRLTLGLIHKW